MALRTASCLALGLGLATAAACAKKSAATSSPVAELAAGSSAPPGPAGSATAGSAAAFASSTAGSAPPAAVAGAWSRQPIASLGKVPATTIELPPGATIERSEVGYGPMDGETLPEDATVVDIHAAGWSLRVEAPRDTAYGSAAAMQQGLHLAPGDVVLSRALGDGGWIAAWKDVSGGLWVNGVRRSPHVVCDSQGTVPSMAGVEELVRACDSIAIVAGP